MGECEGMNFHIPKRTPILGVGDLDGFPNFQTQSYGQKKGRESNCQFDFRPLKVGNHFDLVACRCCATYRWKRIDEGYNFASDLTLIRGLYTRLWASKVA